MWLPRRPGNTCTHRLETIVIVGAEGDTRDSFENAARFRWKTARGEIGPISRDSARRIIPNRKFDRVPR